MIKFVLLLLLSTAQLFAQTPTEQEKVFDYTNFHDCGMITRYASNRIPPQCFKEALNLYLDEDLSISRRSGFAKYNSTPCAGLQSVRGLWRFTATDGTKYLVINSSTSFFQTSGSGDCTSITGLSGLNLTATYECVQALGKLVCTNGTNTPFSWDGTSVTSLATMPIGKHIGTFRNRIITADVSGARTRLRLSGELDITDWTVQIPGLSTTPANIDISGTNDGLPVTCLMGEYQNAYLIGRDYDLFALYGNDRRDFTLRKISNEIGCLAPFTVKEKNNSLVWLSRRGIEKMSGSSITRISDGIRDQIDGIVAGYRNTRSKTYTAQSDWEAGLANTTAAGLGAPMSTTLSPGNVVASTWAANDTTNGDFNSGTLTNTEPVSNSLFLLYHPANSPLLDNFSDGESASNPTWSGICLAGSWYVESNKLVYKCGVLDSIPCSCSQTVSTTTSSGSGTWSIYMGVSAGGSTWGRARFTFIQTSLSPQNGYAVEIDGDNNTIKLYRITAGADTELASDAISNHTCSNLVISRSLGGIFTINDTSCGASLTATDNTYWGDSLGMKVSGRASIIYGAHYYPSFDNIYTNQGGFYETSGNIVSQVFNTGFSTPIAGANTFVDYEPSGTQVDYFMRHSPTGSGGWSDWQASSMPDTGQYVEQYIQYKANLYSNSITKSPQVDYVYLSATTSGYYIPGCINTTGMSSWGDFKPIEASATGVISYSVSTGASCNEVTRATASWSSQSPNSPITLSTAAFLGVRVKLHPNYPDANCALQSLEQDWEESSNRPELASAVYRNRYWLFYTTNPASSAYNDATLVLDENDKWVQFSGINAASAVLYNEKLYTGDSTNTGYVYQQNIGYDDNVSSFTFSFTTADYDFGNPAEKKIFKRLYLFLKSEKDSLKNIDLSVSYSLDGSSVTYSLNSADLNEATEAGYFVAKFPFTDSNPNTGHWLSIKVSYTGNQAPVNVYGMKIVYVPIGWD